MRLDLLKALNAARAERRAAVLVTDLDGGRRGLVLRRVASGDPLRSRSARPCAPGAAA